MESIRYETVEPLPGLAPWVGGKRNLARVLVEKIERLPYAEFIKGYDRPSTLFYLDPPYWGRETLYGKGLFGREDFERLAELLAGLRGRFILSLNDLPEVRKLFRRFRVEPVRVTYKTKPGCAEGKELIITGGGGR